MIIDKEYKDVDAWKKVGSTYKCGCCGRIPTFVDICDLKVCPHCDHQMWWYEKDDGSVGFMYKTGDQKEINRWLFPTMYREKMS